MDRSVAFNNAGVMALNNGYRRAALELFRGALETKLVLERSLSGMGPAVVEEDDDDSMSTATNDDGNNNSNNPAEHSMDLQEDDEHQQERIYEQPQPRQQRLSARPSSSSSQPTVVPQDVAVPERQDALQQQQQQQPECVIRAESHLSNLSRYSTPLDESERRMLAAANGGDEASASAIEEGISDPVIPYANRDFNPYIYLRPFPLPSQQQQQQQQQQRGSSPPEDSISATQITSAVIVFNLGLVHHHASRRSAKAAAFYEISAALLSAEPISRSTVLLRVAIMNNFGVWCYENGNDNGETLRTCMEHLSTVLDYARRLDNGIDGTSVIDRDVEESVTNNINYIITPPNGGSPAA